MRILNSPSSLATGVSGIALVQLAQLLSNCKRILALFIAFQTLVHKLTPSKFLLLVDMASLAKFCDSVDTAELASELGMKPLQVKQWLSLPLKLFL